MSVTFIQRVELTGTQAAIEFTSIPQTYDDLIIAYSLRSNRNAGVDIGRITFNNNSSNYSVRHFIGFGSGNGYTEGYSTSFVNFYGVCGATTAANTFGIAHFYIPNYRASQTKSTSGEWAFEDNNASAWQGMTAGIWANNTAISSIKVDVAEFGSSFLSGSSATLYGITKGSSNGVTVS